ncbi:MAG: PAS domain-containing protein [Pseudomonadota bacterium]
MARRPSSAGISITDMRRALHNAIGAAPYAIAVFDRRMHYVAASPPWAARHGTSAKALIGEPYRGNDAAAQPWLAAHQRALAGEHVACDAERLVLADGAVVWHRWACYPWHEGGDKAAPVAGIVVHIEDVTREIDVRQEHHLALERLRLALEAGHQALWEIHVPSRTVRLLYDFTHRSLPLEVLPHTFDDLTRLIHKGDLESLGEPVKRLLDGESQSLSEVFRVILPDGECRWLQCQCMAVKNREDGRAELVIATHADVTQQRSDEEATLKAKERLEFALAGANDGLWDWNLQTSEIYVSPRWLEQLGYAPNEVEVSFDFWRNAIHPDDRERVASRAIARMEGAAQYQIGVVAPFNYEYRLRGKDGRYRWFLSRGQTVAFDANGRPLRVVGIHTDVSERKQMEQQLIAARDVAEDASQAKSAFIANMSHEIRTPLTGVMGMLELMQDTNLDAEQRRLVDIAKTSADCLLAVVNDILDLSRLEAGHLDQRPRVFDMKTLVGQVISALQQRADAKGLSLIHQPGPWSDLALHADADRVRQILFNLIGNAVKFTRKGGVTVSTAIEPMQWDGVKVKCTVSDTGIGIPLDKQGFIFERFRQVDGSLTREHEGSGLGLSITKEIVELMGGAMGFESQPGVGSRFWFELPLAKAPSDADESDSLKAAAQRSAKQRILVAEDNEVNQILIRALLDKHGHDVTIVENGVDALEMVQIQDFDIIFMDIQMPKMDGLAATRAIRKLGGAKGKVPIVALTSHAMAGQRESYLATGMTDFLAKPIDARQLLNVVETAGILPRPERSRTG